MGGFRAHHGQSVEAGLDGARVLHGDIKSVFPPFLLGLISNRPDLSGLLRARRERPTALGTRSRSRPKRFGASSLERNVTPVRFPPGRSMLATNPFLTESPPRQKTLGMVVVAVLTASAAAVELNPAMTFTLRRIRSAASAGNRPRSVVTSSNLVGRASSVVESKWLELAHKLPPKELH